jgi:CDP-diacylglycerol--serine O-phosphatidyltransferase
MPRLAFITPVTFLYTLGIAFLMVSRLPVYSGKKFGTRVPPEMVLPVFVFVVLFFALLLSYPWEVLTIGALLYLGSLPFGWLSYRDYERKMAMPAKADALSPAMQDQSQPGSPGHQPSSDAVESERPPRLN